MKGAFDCILRKTSLNNRGYAIIYYNGKAQLAHRVAYMKTHPNEDISCKLILHKCDVKNCVNPEHLFSGTALDNTRDMINKGRMRYAHGEEASKARLTWEDVREIRKIYKKKKRGLLKKLYENYGVSKGTMLDIVKYRSWRYV